MAKSLERKVVNKLKGAIKFIFSHRFIPVLKGTIAYLLAFIFIFLRRFDDLSQFPVVYSSMMIIVIANGAGRSVGACIQMITLSTLGVSLGCIGFVILAKLNPWPVAQGVVFAAIVYLMALVKARGLRWFGFSLMCILNSFNGIYTSYMLGGVFSPTYLEQYYVAYLWGAVIVLGVNLLVFPTSSEKELRQTLVTSLEHIGTFVHLLAKGYMLEINEEEKAVREHLSQSIRADFGHLTELIAATTIEINYSRFSMKDYQCFVSRTRALQQALITAHSSLVVLEMQDVELFKERFLPETAVAFRRLRKAVDLTIREIGTEMGKPMVIPGTQAKYNEYMDMMERQKASATASTEERSPEEQLANQLAHVSERLAAEVNDETVPPTPWTGTADHSTSEIARPANDGYVSESVTAFPSVSSPEVTKTTHELGNDLPPRSVLTCGAQRLRAEFDMFSAAQHRTLQDALISGKLQGATDEDLRIHSLRPSLKETFGFDYILGDPEGDLPPQERAEHKQAVAEEKDSEDTGSQDLTEERKKMFMEGNSLIRVWGFLFALEQFVGELETLWSSVKPHGVRPKKRLHIHLFEALKRPHQKAKAEDEDTDLPLAEALALLQKRPYTPVKPNIWQRLDYVQQLLQSPTSVFGAKTAAAASVFATLIYASVPRSWFISYAMSSGLLTVVVALAPTLGQSILTLVLQIAGSSLGYLWGLAVLSMFRDVGGYKFNPYGIVCMLIPYALAMQYLLYYMPQFFVVALLGMNGTGVIVATEWVAVQYQHRTNFDSPAFRTAKALTALAVGLAIVTIFQLFILRNPARRTLRLKLAALTFETLSYIVLLQAFARSVLSSNPEYRPSKPALMRVERELRHRELKLQSRNIEVMPLISFAAAEPQFSKPFRKDLALRFVRSNQLVLDRVREGRAALGTQQFEDFILMHFVSVLAPYRVRNTRAIKSQLYLIASSWQSKAPLPHDTPMYAMTDSDRADFIHDLLVLGSQFARTEGGRKSIHSREFMRYVGYVLGVFSISDPLIAMEDISKKMFGELESKLL